jgi:predicted lipid-binding transport protein (Tim44 family)
MVSYSDVKIGSKKTIKSVKRLLKNGKIDPKRTCLDEFIVRNRQLWKKMGLGPFTTIGATTGTGVVVGMTAGGAGAAISAGTVAGGQLIGGALVGGLMGGWIGLAIAGPAFIAYEGTQIARFVKNNRTIRVISNARDGVEAEHIVKFTKKYLKKYPKDKKYITAKKMIHIISEADENRLLCNGKLVRKRGIRKIIKKMKKKNPSKLADFLANRKEIFHYIHDMVKNSK